MSRRYLVRPLPSPGAGILPAEVAHHLTVVRVRPGDEVVLFDGAGCEARARIVGVGRREVKVEIGPAEAVDREPRVRVELACALPRGSRADWLFEHGTEVGVAVFRPVLFARTRVSRAERHSRWERIVAAAAEQCDRSRLPEVRQEVGLAGLLDDPTLPAERYLADPGASVALGPARSGHLVLVVGPEGGLTDGEVEELVAAGFVRCGLGPLTLRTETAALVGLARLLA